jgi:transposase-like protein
MAQGQKLSDEKRAQIIALLLTGESIPKTARLAGVAESTVSAIKASDDFGRLRTLKRESEPSIHELVTAHLTTSLEAANALARSIRDDKEWFARQSAYDIAMLYGTLSDKAIRIYDAKLRSERLELERQQLESDDPDTAAAGRDNVGGSR